jgi:hypothetical protein
MRPPLTRTLRATLLAAALLAAGALLRPAPGAAQTFFAESDALRPDTALELTLSDLTDRSNADSGGPLTFDHVDSSLRRLDGRLRRGWVALGAMGEARRFHETTESFEQRDDRDQSAGYGALVLEGLLTKESDALFLVLSTSGRHEAFAYDGYLRLLDATVGAQGGLVYRIGFLIAGYIGGREELELRITDPALPYAQERYAFDYRAWLAGLQFGDPEGFGLQLVAQRKDTPAVRGTTIDLEQGFEELQRAVLGLGVFRTDYSRTRARQAFTGESRRETSEQEFSLGLQITAHFLVAFSQKRINDLQGFTLLGVPSTSRIDRTENLLRFALRF